MFIYKRSTKDNYIYNLKGIFGMKLMGSVQEQQDKIQIYLKTLTNPAIAKY